MVADGRRSPGTREAYRRKLDSDVLPALGEVRLGELTTPLVDSVIRSITERVGPPTAKSSRTVISGALNLAVRHGAIVTNPVRDVETIASRPKRYPRALDEDERQAWFAMLASDPRAVTADLRDLKSFLLAAGVRIGEALGLLWSDVDPSIGEVETRHQVMRVKGEGSSLSARRARRGEASQAAGMVRRDPRGQTCAGIHPNEPVFCDAMGGFRDPNNVRRDLRRARAPHGSQVRQGLGAALARPADGQTVPTAGGPGVRLATLTSRTRRGPTGARRGGHRRGPRGPLRVKAAERSTLLSQAKEASQPEQGDALAWITSHTFRKTTATIPDDAG